MRRIREILFLSVIGLAIYGPVQAATPWLLVNGGAESGSTTGWSNSQNYFSAVNNQANAYQGDWYFETAHVFNGTNATGALSQSVGLAPYVGQLNDLIITIAAAQEPGFATDTSTSTSYRYVAFAAVYFYDSNNLPLDSGWTLAVNGTSNWQNFTSSFSFLPYLNQVASIRIDAYGGWQNVSTGSVGYVVQGSWITDPPLWTRFDGISVSLGINPGPFVCNIHGSPCTNGQSVQVLAGNHDEFSLPTEPTFAGPELAGLGICTGSRDFDDIAPDKHFCQTLTGIPMNTAVAILELRLRAASSSTPCNDAIALQVEGSSFLWSSYIGTSGCHSGAGILSYDWAPNSIDTICLNLGSLTDTNGQCLNLLPYMRESGRLDIYVQDDTGVDFARLALATCPCTPPPPNMVAWWTLDDKSGTVATDLTGTNNGSYLSTSSPAANSCGKVDFDRTFDGVSSSVTVPDQASLRFGSGAFSIDMWILPNAATGALLERFDSATTMGYRLFLSSNNLVLLLHDGSQFAIMLSNIPVSTGVWHHVAATASSVSSGLRSLTLYLDGQIVAGPVGQSIGSVSSNNAVPLYLGRPVAGGSYYNGEMDEVELFNRRLNATEVSNIYQAGIAGKCKCVCPGDVNGDGSVNGLDISAFDRCFQSAGLPGDHCPCADLNHDGYVDSTDLTLFVAAVMAGSC